MRNQVDGTLTIKGVVEAGLGYTVFAYAGLFEEIRAGSLVALPFESRAVLDILPCDPPRPGAILLRSASSAKPSFRKSIASSKAACGRVHF